jgi:hypothetical protein
MVQTRTKRVPDSRNPFRIHTYEKRGEGWGYHRFQITEIADLVLVLPQNRRKKEPQKTLKSFRMNNFLVIVLDNLIRIITLQKQWVGVEGNEALSN